jgi:hypothetical protein
MQALLQLMELGKFPYLDARLNAAGAQPENARNMQTGCGNSHFLETGSIPETGRESRKIGATGAGKADFPCVKNRAGYAIQSHTNQPFSSPKIHTMPQLEKQMH